MGKSKGKRKGAALESPVAATTALPGSIEERVIEIVCEKLAVNREEVARSTSFVDDIGADSLDIVEMFMGVEERFKITVSDEEAESIKTVGSLIDYVERELATK